MRQPHRSVVILGAGYAGLLCATRLARKARGLSVSITLVNDAETFTERLRLHEYATNRAILWRSIPDVLKGTDIAFVQGSVVAIAPEAKAVTIACAGEERRLAYDHLVYALGSITDRESVSGVAAHAYTLTPRGPLSAAAMRAALPALQTAGGRVVVCGGGATGIETAAELASSSPRLKVSLVTRGEFGAFLGNEVARRMRHVLDQLGVAIIERTAITEVRADAIVTADGQLLAHELCVWTGGFKALPLAREAGIAVNDRDQILIDPFMQSISSPDIFAIGDAAHSREEPGAPLRMSAYTALILGAHGADCVNAILRGRSPKPLSFAYVEQGIALGRGNAIGFGKSADDIPQPPYITGRLASGMRAFGLKFLAMSAAREKRWLGGYVWAGMGRYARAQRRAAAHAGTPAQVGAGAAGQ
jgi:NADH dehydrogenase FAD-containing subunit